MSLPPYVELHALSNFSFLRGASHPGELVQRARELGYAGLALTDECSLAGVVRAHRACREARGGDFKLIIGSELRLRGGPKLVLLAGDRPGYGQLAALITRGRRAAKKGAYQLHPADLDGGLSGCLALYLPVAQVPMTVATQQAGRLKENFPDRAWLAAELVQEGSDALRMEQLRRLARTTGLPLVASGDVHAHDRHRRALRDTLNAIRLRTSVQEAGFKLHRNAERCLRRRRQLAALYPRPWLEETLHIAGRCHFSLDMLRYEYPEELVPPRTTPTAWLRKLTEQGMVRRWPGGPPAKVRRLVERELALIAELRYEPYFLTVHEIVHFARSRNIFCQGRGSAANSAVCYCLHITEVNPAHMEMLFERFISRERGEPPDIDVDFEHERREEVIQHIYEKYGRERAALAATVITYQPRSALRDVGKALGLAPDQLDRLAGNLQGWDGPHMAPQALREAGFDPKNATVKRVLALADALIGFPRHLSQHVGGFVISRDALSQLVPVENAAMPGRTIIQWDKDDLDTLGLLKVDCLGLGMLSAIHRAFDLIAARGGKRLSLSGIPADDPQVYAMIQRADTVGVFQIESRAQMAMLPRLRPENYYDLVIEVALIRPGPIQGDMVHPYLRRRQGKEAVDYPSPEVREVLERTLGVPIFQEQVIKLAMVAAGFSPGEADGLRRAMATWRRRGDLQGYEQRLVEGMRENGYDEAFARRIYAQIRGFGEYGFPESHAASFALLVYVSAWLKTHEPAAFTCALLNSQPMGFYAPAQLVQDARRHGVEVRPVDVRFSQWDCTLEEPLKKPGTDLKSVPVPPPVLRLGLRLVKHLSRPAAQRLEAARICTPFRNTRDLARRAGLDRRALHALADADALRGLSGHRHRAHWAVLDEKMGSIPIFSSGTDLKSAPLPALRVPTEGEDIAADYASLGLSLRRHPLALLRGQLDRLGVVQSGRLAAWPHGRLVHTAGLVICRQRPGSASGVLFITLEDETGHSQVIVWPKLVARQRRIVLQSRLLGVAGKLQRQGAVVHIIATRLEDHSPLLGQLNPRSRDFH